MSSKLITRKYMKDLIRKNRPMHTSNEAYKEMDRVALAIITEAIATATREGRKTVMDRDIVFATKDFANTVTGGSA